MNDPSAQPVGQAEPTRPSPPASAGVLCPFCGTSQPAAEVAAAGLCKACRNRMDPMARIATHNAMGPWFVRDLSNPFAPGCSYETLSAMCARGRVKLNSVVRGPTTQQFWRLAAHTPGVSVLLGQCHACAERVASDAERCPSCDAVLRPAVAVGIGRFTTLDDRQQLGLPPVRVTSDADDPHSALDSLTQALGHAESERIGGVFPRDPSAALRHHADARSSTPQTARSGPVRLLAAGLVLAIVLCCGLALWAVVLPAMGVRTGVEEITGLTAARTDQPRAAAASVRSEAASDARTSDASASGSTSSGSPALEDRPADGIAGPSEAGSTDVPPPAANDGDDPAEASNTANDDPPADALPNATRALITERHRAALSSELADLRALQADIQAIAREAFDERSTDHPDFAARFPGLAAMHAWAARAITERLALDAMGVR